MTILDKLSGLISKCESKAQSIGASSLSMPDQGLRRIDEHILYLYKKEEGSDKKIVRKIVSKLLYSRNLCKSIGIIGKKYDYIGYKVENEITAHVINVLENKGFRLDLK